MAGSATDEDEDLFEPTEELEGEDQEGQDQDGEGEEPETDEEETIIGFGEDDPGEQDEAGLVPHLRSRLKEQAAEIRELRTKAPAPRPIEVGPKPTMEGCEYDEEAYDQALIDWNERKAEAGRQTAQANQPAQAFQDEVRGALDQFATHKAAIKVKDFAEAEAEVITTLNREQVLVLTMAAKNSATLMYALGKHPDRLAALKAITNPVKLAVAVANLERELKVTTKRRAPEPEGVVRGSAPLSSGKGDKHLAKLEAEADRTGDRTKLIAYRKSRQAKG